MTIDIFKKAFEEIINYYNNDCLKNQKINNKNFKIKFDYNHFNSLNKDEDFEKVLKDIISDINNLRQENQSQLIDDKFDVRIFAKNELILSSANVAFESILECYKNLSYLTSDHNGNKVLEIDDNFAIKKVSSLASNILSRYEHLPTRLKKNSELSIIIDILKVLTNTNDLDRVLNLSREVLVKYNEILHLDQFVDYNVLVEEYGWVHDVVKLSRVSAGVVGLLVNADIYSGVLSKNYYKAQKSVA
ncbi:hypothetical protein SGLAD_v1c08730 [Spiroplasma gladiatoris]|uniref:Uncharacterized protein n=1 Tax=Spiroplasma gladiatoris TaxID=2143 RepID=A0A4P7AII6_9MOLU|nr:hypothetical protein [Spiroplasma gladiatoris]QBQ08072.1 hypothetical protein SGLAD_v1c08730 [Spiroplasma gladiatoris]